MGMIKDLILKLMGKKKVIGFVAAALISVLAFVLGEPAAYLKEAICDAPTIELPDSIKAKSPMGKEALVKPKAN